MSEPTGRDGLLQKAKVALSGLAANTKAAAHLTAKQAERTKLTQAMLPKAYRALGKEIYQAGRFRDEYSDLYRQISERVAQIKRLKEATPSESTQGFSDKAKAAAQKAKDAATAKFLSVKLEGDLSNLGRSAYEKHGNGAGSEELVTAIANQQARIQKLDAKITEIEDSHSGQWFTPRRIMVAGFVGVLAIGLFIIGSMSSGPKERTSDNIATASSVQGNDQVEHETVTTVEVTIPDFSQVDYNVDFGTVDYSQGPNGEPITQRNQSQFSNPPPTDIDEGDEVLDMPITESGYLDSNGAFVRHGILTAWSVPPRNGSEGQKRLEVPYKEGAPHGAYKSWRQDDQSLLETKSFINGELHGEIIRSHRNGQKGVEAYCVKGRLHGSYKTWFPDGQARSEEYYVEGKLHGPGKEWHENGQLAIENNYSNGDPLGRATSYYDNGQILLDGEWDHGKRIGTWMGWFQDGTRRYEEVNNGRYTIVKTWHPKVFGGNLASVVPYLDGEMHGREIHYDHFIDHDREGVVDFWREWENGEVVASGP